MDSLPDLRILNFWEAFDSIEPIGLPAQEQLMRVAVAWIVSALSGKEIDPERIKAFPDLASTADDSQEDRQARARRERAAFR